MDFRKPESFYHNIHNVAALLKQFFRALPDPLVPTRHYSKFVDAARKLQIPEWSQKKSNSYATGIGHAIQRRDALRRIIIDLPVPNFATLKVLALVRHNLLNYP
jgi:Rho GTPase-activating protein RGD1